MTVPAVPAPKTAKAKSSDAPAAGAAASDHLPFTFDMPETSAQLEKIVGALSPEDTAVARRGGGRGGGRGGRRADASRGGTARRRETFLGLLLTRIREDRLAGTAPLPVAYLDVVSSAQIAAVAATVPPDCGGRRDFAATAARARLEKMSARLRRAPSRRRHGMAPRANPPPPLPLRRSLPHHG